MALERRECLLRVYRLQSGYTQEELSYLIFKRYDLDVSSAMISHYENNRKPMSLVVLKAMAGIFRRPMDDFYKWSGT